LTIVIGAHLLAPMQFPVLPESAIIFNTENLASTWIDESYWMQLQRFQVWDYSQDNSVQLSRRLHKQVRFIPISYVPELTRVQRSHEDIDVLFYGLVAPRRAALFAALRERGLALHHAFGVYGDARDELIARSKLILNVHYCLPGAFESIRVSYALANRKAVLTELNPGEVVDADLIGGLATAPYDELATACTALVSDAALRQRLAAVGFEAFRARDAGAVLQQALESGEKASKFLLNVLDQNMPGEALSIDWRKERKHQEIYPGRKKIGLCMIVKNEVNVIVECLESARPLLDYVLIEDTGSTDGTQSTVRVFLAQYGIPGEVIEEPWKDFAHNRTLALQKLRERTEIDYALIIDADEVLVFDQGFDSDEFKKGLTDDLYNVKIRLHGTDYYRPQILKNSLPFRYRGVLHEFVEGPDGHSAGTAAGFHIFSGSEGARSRNPRKYEEDVVVLLRALSREQDAFLISRYTFYLAQSCRDAGRKEEALHYYVQRSKLGYWDQEIYISLLETSSLREQLGYPDFEVIGSFLHAYEACPWRAEALHRAMRYCRVGSKFHQGYLIGRQALSIPRPETGLFVQGWVYDYGVIHEFSVLAYWSGHYRESLEASMRLLEERRIPLDQLPRVQMNANFARDKLGT
jgi:glycosyltransferase involved in cell wall biosynthesis